MAQSPDPTRQEHIESLPAPASPRSLTSSEPEPPPNVQVSPTPSAQLPPHLTPLTREQHQLLRETTNAPLELVDGLLVNLGEMASENHRRSQKYLTYCFQLVHAKGNANLLVYTELDLNIPTLKDALHRIKEQEKQRLLQEAADGSPSKSSRSSSTMSEGSSSSPQRKPVTIRLPDIAVGPYFSSDTELSPRSKKQVFNEGRMPEVVVEVTSPSTYHVDLYFKWVEYARCGIKEYLIIDRTKNRVVRGYLDKRGKQVPNGDPDYEPSPDRASKQTASSSVALPYYCRQVFQGEDIVKAKFLELLTDKNMIKVSRILSPKHTEEMMKAEDQRYQRVIKERDEVIKERDEVAKERDEVVKERDEVVKERDEEIRRLREENDQLRQRGGKADSEKRQQDKRTAGKEARASKVGSPSKSPSKKRPRNDKQVKN